MDHPIISPKKLIEVALPLDAINDASAREKSIRQGHPSSLHLWWARRPLAAARAVIFSQLVHDPEDLWRCQNPDTEPNKQVKGHWTKARARLFALIEELVRWENTTNEEVLEAAREEIRRSWRETCELNRNHPQSKELFDPNRLPGLHDPFAGGGAIPLEAQRLGLDAYATDLNPVAVLINKAMIEIPPAFADRSPVSTGDDIKAAKTRRLNLDHEYRGAAGLAEDVRYYGEWILDKLQKQIGHLYPKVTISDSSAARRRDLKSLNGKQLDVIAWIWARTIRSPNPAFRHVEVPLVTSFVLSAKKGKGAFVVPVVQADAYHFEVHTGAPPEGLREGTSIGARKGFRCLLSGAPMDFNYIREEGLAGRLGTKLMAIVADGKPGRIYLDPDPAHESTAKSDTPTWIPSTLLPEKHRSISAQLYGLNTHASLFTDRQLIGLTAISDLIIEVRDKIRADSVSSGVADDGLSLHEGGRGPTAYAEAVSVYLAFCLDKLADLANGLCRWEPVAQCPRQLFGRQTIPMVWDFAEGNILGTSSGSWRVIVDGFERAFSNAFSGSKCTTTSLAKQGDAQTQDISFRRFVSTDPPYYDNIGYSDLSDFFYVWLRRSLREVYPSLFATISVPKAEELIAAASRHGSKEKAEVFFLNGMTCAMRRVAELAHPASPITIYYAFKQSETKNDLTNSTGWDTFLEAVITAGLSLSGTWPLRTENSSRMVGHGTNALASSVVLVCRPRDKSAPTISRRQFIRLINEVLPKALDDMTRESEGLPSPVAPVDLSQAIIGPGMAIFSKYSAVLEADGSPMSVRTALQIINRFLAEDDFDADTQFCLHWFEQYGWDTGKFGDADTLARAKGTSVDGVKQAGVLHAAGGNVRLLRWAEYPSEWDPRSDHRLPIWEVLHQLIRVFNTDGETGAAVVFAAVQSKAEAARQLAYRLYTLCERKGWAEDARAYNEVVTSWSSIESTAAKEPAATQRTLFDN